MSVELRHVVTVPVYSLSVVASVFAAFLLAGYHTNAARFAQLQYGYDYQHAWFYTSGQSVHSPFLNTHTSVRFASDNGT